VRVKICGITRPQDAALAEEAGAHAIGLVFAGTRRRLDPARAREVARGAGPLVVRVGVFEDHPEDEIWRAVEAAGLDAVQLHGDEPPELALRLARAVRVIKAFRMVGPVDAAAALAYPADAILLDGREAGSGRAWNLSWASSLAGNPRLILSGGLTPENVARAIREARPGAVDVASGVESAPGVKDPGKVRAFVGAALRAAAY
jgi:phosphoribosylanthranilate isomerase